MNSYPAPSATKLSVNDVDLTHVLRVLRRRWLPLLLIPLLLGVVTYVLFSRQPPVYQASTSLMATPADTGNTVLSGATVTASQLPQGAVENVIHSRSTVTRTITLIDATNLPEKVKARIANSLRDELASDVYKRVTVTARLDQFQRGVYEIRANAESPQAAELLATSATKALLDWDLQRAQEGVSRARQNIQDQLNNINTRLNATTPGTADYQSLVAARGQLILNLSQATVFQEGARGSLTLLSDANPPRSPHRPQTPPERCSCGTYHTVRRGRSGAAAGFAAPQNPLDSRYHRAGRTCTGRASPASGQ